MKNILRAIAFGAMLVWFVLFVIMPQDDLGYNAAIKDKYRRLKEIDSPKVVLVGDSNVAFGIDSGMIEEAFEMEVVNLGLHGGIGQTMGAELLKGNVSQGDIIILLPASYSYETAGIRDGVLMWYAMENDLSIWLTLQNPDVKVMINSFPTYLKKAMGLWIKHEGNRVTSSIYNRLSFNEYGDIKLDRPENVMENGFIDNDGFDSKYLSEAMRDYWNDLGEYVSEHGGMLFMGVPPILKEDLKLSDGELGLLENQLRTELNFPVISRFQDYIFPKEMFFDTNFHLNNTGVQVRTELLIEDIKGYTEKAD